MTTRTIYEMSSKSKPLSTTVSLTILKPVQHVFAAVIRPVPYFCESTSGPMAEGKTIQFKFPEMTREFPVEIKRVIPNKEIVCEWGSATGGNNICTFRFGKPQDHNPSANYEGDATTVEVTESGWTNTDAGHKACLDNNMGWTNMLCSLKAWLEHGINLRRGAFLHHKF